MRTVSYLLLALFSAGMAVPYSAEAFTPRTKCNRDQRIATTGVVDRVVDGDTTMVQTATGNYSIRMMGIDTPESHYLGKSQGEWADKATARLRRILPEGTPVALELSDTPCDKYGRVLAWIHKGDINVNSLMVKGGYAVNYCIAPDMKYCEEFGAYVEKAMASRAAMWSQDQVELPYEYRLRVGNRTQTKWVGNMKTKDVFKPGQTEKVPVADRVFFMEREDIRAPFREVN
jgi:micrococcal nuclease